MSQHKWISEHLNSITTPTVKPIPDEVIEALISVIETYASEISESKTEEMEVLDYMVQSLGSDQQYGKEHLIKEHLINASVWPFRPDFDIV